MFGFFEMIKIMIAISCVLCIVGMMMPAKKTPAIGLIIGMIVIASVLGPFIGEGIPKLKEFDKLNFTVEAKSYENLLKEQTIEMTKQQMEEDIKERCMNLTGNLPLEVTIETELQEDVLHLKTITLSIEEGDASKVQKEIEEVYQPDEVIVGQVEK